MSEQDAKDINQMMANTAEVAVGKPRKSKFGVMVVLCIVLGIGLGIFVYQKSLTPPAKTPVAKPSPVSSPLAAVPSPVVPHISIVNAEPKTVDFPKAGKIRAYYVVGGWMPLGMTLTDAAGKHSLKIPAGDPGTLMKVYDTGYSITGPTTISMETFLGEDATKLSIGWAKPVSNKCGFNGFGVVDIAQYITWATEQAKGEPIVSIQCWGDYSPNPTQTDAKDFNDYTMIWSYTPSGTTSSPSPSASAAASASPSPSPSPSPSRSASPSPSSSALSSPSPSPSRSASPSLSPSASPSPRVSMPDTSGGTPVTGVFEVTVGTLSIGVLLLGVGLLGLLVL